MANQQHLDILKQGIEAWNEWRENNSDIIPNLTKANLRNAFLGNADLKCANLENADLKNASLWKADLGYANLENADLKNASLWKADLRNANLEYADLENANLRNAFLENADLGNANLENANLGNANLGNANLGNANLGNANLENANLENANLFRVIGLRTAFKGATLTGVCIEDWNINSETNFEEVICDYIYFKRFGEERRPSDSNKNFKPGEFVKLFEKSIETVDLIFLGGIDWQIFLTVFQELQLESESGELLIQAIEKKRNGAFVIRVDLPVGLDKKEIRVSFWSKYKPLLKAKDRKIKLLSQQEGFDSQQMEIIRKDNTKLLGIIETMVEKEKIKYDLSVAKFGGGFAGEDYTGNLIHNYAPEQKQTLAEAAAEIQKLLKQLE
jgi:hypothetical protein